MRNFLRGWTGPAPNIGCLTSFSTLSYQWSRYRYRRQTYSAARIILQEEAGFTDRQLLYGGADVTWIIGVHSGVLSALNPRNGWLAHVLRIVGR